MCCGLFRLCFSLSSFFCPLEASPLECVAVACELRIFCLTGIVVLFHTDLSTMRVSQQIRVYCSLFVTFERTTRRKWIIHYVRVFCRYFLLLRQHCDVLPTGVVMCTSHVPGQTVVDMCSVSILSLVFGRRGRLDRG